MLPASARERCPFFVLSDSQVCQISQICWNWAQDARLVSLAITQAAQSCWKLLLVPHEAQTMTESSYVDDKTPDYTEISHFCVISTVSEGVIEERPRCLHYLNFSVRRISTSKLGALFCSSGWRYSWWASSEIPIAQPAETDDDNTAHP